MHPIKLIVFVGIAGSRSDFIAGWVGKLPNFVESFWSFNPITGQSITSTQHTLSLDYPEQLTSFLHDHQYRLDPTATLTYATKVHQVSPDCAVTLDPTTVHLIPIDLTGLDPIALQWESVIKTFGRAHRLQTISWVIDHYIDKEEITNQDRIDHLDQKLKKLLQQIKLPPQQPGLKYVEIFKKGGSYLIAEELGIVVDDEYHQYWDYMLPLSITPKQVTLWGHEFKLTDYISY
jgi:hypothetical protein